MPSCRHRSAFAFAFASRRAWLVLACGLVGAAGVVALGCSSASDGVAPATPTTDGGADASFDDGGGDGSASVGPAAIPLQGCGVNYTAAVSFGDGSQTLRLIVDTGSSVLGVAGSTCAACADAGVTPLYTPTAAAKDKNAPAAEKFANGEGWSGEIYDDAVTIGASAPVHVNVVDIGAQSGFFSDAWCGVKSNQGILGLGPSDLLLAGTTSYLDSQKAAGTPDVFSFQLCDATGSLWLGGFDPRAQPAYTPLIAGQRFYTVTVSGITVAGVGTGLAASSLGNAFLDTGGDALWLPQAAFDAVTAAIGKDATFTSLFGDAKTFFSSANTDCKSLTQTSAELDAMLPPLAFTFGSGIVVDAPATSSYLMKLTDCGYRPSLFTRGVATQGLPGIELGAPFLRSKVVVIDRAQQRVGFAKGSCGG